MACQLNLTSLLVNGAPSCHFTPLRSLYVIVRPSLEMPPFVNDGTSAARLGTKFLPVASTVTSVSNERRLIMPSVVFAESIGLSEFGSRWTPMRSSPGRDHE